MSAHCLSMSVVRASNQPHPHTMHGCSRLDSNRWERLLIMTATVAQRKANLREGLLQSCDWYGNLEDMVHGYRGKSPSEDLNVHRPYRPGKDPSGRTGATSPSQ